MLLNADDERLTAEQKWQLRNNIASWAISGMRPTDVEIDRVVRTMLGIITEEEAIAEIEAQIRQSREEEQEP